MLALIFDKKALGEEEQEEYVMGFDPDSAGNRYVYNLMGLMEKRQITVCVGAGIMETLGCKSNGMPVSLSMAVFAAYSEVQVLFVQILEEWAKKPKVKYVHLDMEWPLRSGKKQSFYADLVENVLTLCHLSER